LRSQRRNRARSSTGQNLENGVGIQQAALFTHGHCPLQNIAQLPDIAWPVVTAQSRNAGVSNLAAQLQSFADLFK
jgi:hypothetical protein